MEKSKSSTFNRLLDNMSDKWDKSVGTFVWDFFKPIADMFSDLFIELADAVNLLDVDKLNGDLLDMFIKQRSLLNRREETFADGTISIEGEEGTRVDRTKVKVSSDTCVYSFKNNFTIPETGYIEVPIKADVGGNIGNAPKGQINKFPVTVSGVNKCYNNESFVNGYEKEDDDTFRDRYYELIRTPPISGNVAHYELWAKEVEGVGEVRVFPVPEGKNTVHVMLVDINGIPADEELIENVQKYIDPNKNGDGLGVAPIGAVTTVMGANEKPIDVSVNIYSDSRITRTDNLTKDILNNIDEYLRSVAFKESYISYAKIGRVILNTNGVFDYDELKINDGISNIEIDNNSVAVIGEVRVNGE